MKRNINGMIALLSLLCLIGTVKLSSLPLLPLFSEDSFWYTSATVRESFSLLYDLFVGFLLSAVFYFIVEYLKRQRSRTSSRKSVSASRQDSSAWLCSLHSSQSCPAFLLQSGILPRWAVPLSVRSGDWHKAVSLRHCAVRTFLDCPASQYRPNVIDADTVHSKNRFRRLISCHLVTVGLHCYRSTVPPKSLYIPNHKVSCTTLFIHYQSCFVGSSIQPFSR